MKYCSNCGAQLDDEARFCPRCGLKTPEVQRPQEPYQQPPQEPPYQQRPQEPPYQQRPQEPVSAPQEGEGVMASAVAGEVVLSTWEAPKPQPNAGPQRQAPPTGAPQGGYQQSQGSYRQNQSGYQQTQGGYQQTQGGYQQTQGQQGGYQQPQGAYQAPRGAQPQGGYQGPQPPRGGTQPPRSQYQQRPASPQGGQPQAKKKGRGGCIVAIFIISLIIAIIVALFSGCKHINLPPDPGTPPPAPHSGCFVHEADTLIFNGDGKTIVWHFDREVSGIGNQGEGQYVFLFDHGKCRYDVAEDFRIIKTEEPEDLHTFVLFRPTSDTSISILRDDLPGAVAETFLKSVAAAAADPQ
jgi:hypothetical protein